MKNYPKLILASVLFNVAIASHADYSTHPEAQEFIDTMVTKHQFAREDIVSWLSAAEHQESIVKAMSRPAEKVKPWHEYRKHFISERRINGGVAFWEQNRETLANAERDFGVDQAIIVSIIGVETNYGSNTGSYKVIDALSTLAFDYYTYTDKRESRKRFFHLGTGKPALTAPREQHQDPVELKGSYAGAMGLGQFMPSSYRQLCGRFRPGPVRRYLDAIPPMQLPASPTTLPSTAGGRVRQLPCAPISSTTRRKRRLTNSSAPRQTLSRARGAGL